MTDLPSGITEFIDFVHRFIDFVARAVARALIGGCIFIYSGSARLTSFEINFISKRN